MYDTCNSVVNPNSGDEQAHYRVVIRFFAKCVPKPTEMKRQLRDALKEVSWPYDAVNDAEAGDQYADLVDAAFNRAARHLDWDQSTAFDKSPQGAEEVSSSVLAKLPSTDMPPMQSMGSFVLAKINLQKGNINDIISEIRNWAEAARSLAATQGKSIPKTPKPKGSKAPQASRDGGEGERGGVDESREKSGFPADKVPHKDTRSIKEKLSDPNFPEAEKNSIRKSCSKKPCKRMMRDGVCSSGTNCLFSHTHDLVVKALEELKAKKDAGAAGGGGG